MPANMPAAEHPIDASLVRALLQAQHPDLAALSITPVASGWDNAIFRLGDALAVRLPRRAIAAPLVLHEQRWLPELAGRLPLPIPAPVRTGVPGCGYPWAWSVCPWIEGLGADEAPPSPDETARDLAAFLRALHHAASPEAPRNPFRGGPLRDRDLALRERLVSLAERVDVARARQAWEYALAAPAFAGTPVWVHGDLHPANLLVSGGRLAAVLDFGDLTAGDPATDLAAAWMLLPAEARAAFRSAYAPPDAATWRRARGWALSHALACLANSADNPRIARVGVTTLARVLEDPEREGSG